ncbi:MAG: FKBP-type peptidyl-prolyl cis-trans isomerase [Saprospiraceae bacterium]
MKLTNLFAAAALVGLALPAFGQKEVLTPNGYRAFNHTNNVGEKPAPGDLVRLHMAVFLGDTTLMSSYAQGEPAPVPMPAKEEVEGASPILDALNMMSPGDSVTIYQKVDSLLRPFLPASRRAVPEIRYELKLVSVITKAQQAEQQAQAQALVGEVARKTEALISDFKANKIGPKLIQLPSGLQMVIHEVGAGAEVQKGQTLRVHYYGALTDGKMFDNSFERGEPIEFQQGVGQMIAGFDEGAGMLKHGGKATLFIPHQLGYGEEGTPDGTIPAKATLVFYIEVE